jgi:hypothetical protein
MSTVVSPLVTLRWEQIDRVMVAGQQGVFLPWGAYVLATAPNIEVQIDQGAGFVLQAFGADYAFQTRQQSNGWSQASTKDVSTGVWLNNPSAAGDIVRVRWRSGSILLPPPSPIAVSTTAPVPAPGGSNGFRYNGPYPPDAFTVAERFGFQVEAWRMSMHGGQKRVPAAVPTFVQLRGGRRLFPYWRSPAGSGETTIVPSTFVGGASARKKFVFRVCYYDPATGARSELSAERVYFSWRDDKILTIGTLHPAASVWVTI